MKPVLAILGLAVAFIALSLVLQSPKNLKERPQDTQGQSEPEPMPNSGGANKPGQAEAFNPPREGTITTELTFKNRGTLTIEFYPKAAPNAVAQITGLIKKGFYDGVLVHRILPDTVVQFGKGKTKTEGVDAPETDEGIPMLAYEDNNLPHVPGSVGLARTEDKNSATSQLFLDMTSMPMWNGEYCVIGRVVKGVELLSKVERGDAITSFKIKS